MCLNKSSFTRNGPLEPKSLPVHHSPSDQLPSPLSSSNYGVDTILFKNLGYDPGDTVENHEQTKVWVSLANSAL